MQSGLTEHFQKLLLGPHVNRLRHEVSLSIVNEALRDAIDLEEFSHLAAGIEKDWVGNATVRLSI